MFAIQDKRIKLLFYGGRLYLSQVIGRIPQRSPHALSIVKAPTLGTAPVRKRHASRLNM